jgi:multimeric flavodoxin WrbA
MEYKNKKCLIAYFSRKGNNYVDGRIVDLVVGNTEIVARLIHDRVAAEMFHIQTVDGYPADYIQTTEMAKVQLQCHARPEVTKTVPNMKDYDIIFLGYPNCGGPCPWLCLPFWNRMIFPERRSSHSVHMKAAAWDTVNGTSGPAVRRRRF